jgi:hypothetical protein
METLTIILGCLNCCLNWCLRMVNRLRLLWTMPFISVSGCEWTWFFLLLLFFLFSVTSFLCLYFNVHLLCPYFHVYVYFICLYFYSISFLPFIQVNKSALCLQLFFYSFLTKCFDCCFRKGSSVAGAVFEYSAACGALFAAGGTRPRCLHAWDLARETCIQQVSQPLYSMNTFFYITAEHYYHAFDPNIFSAFSLFCITIIQQFHLIKVRCSKDELLFVGNVWVSCLYRELNLLCFNQNYQLFSCPLWRVKMVEPDSQYTSSYRHWDRKNS